MKDKLLVFIIGLLVGAIITTSGFLVYEKMNKNKNPMPTNDGTQMMERPNGETPPEKPEGEPNDGNRPEPPSKNKGSTNSKTN